MLGSRLSRELVLALCLCACGNSLSPRDDGAWSSGGVGGSVAGSASTGAGSGGTAGSGASGMAGGSGAADSAGAGGGGGSGGGVNFPSDPAAYQNLFTTLQVNAQQNLNSSMTPHATRVLADTSALPAVPLDAYGGLNAEPLTATGFFRVEKVDGRWWMVTPAGHRYFYAAVNSTRTNQADNNQAAFASKFGDQPSWAESTSTLLREQGGFYGTGAWSDDDTLASSSQPPNYAQLLSFATSYAGAKGIGSPGTGHYDFPGHVVPVFNEDFTAFCTTRMQGFAERAEDARLIGYFTDNELPFSQSSLADYVAAPDGDANGDAARTWLAQRHPSAPNTIQGADADEFLTYVVDVYFSKVVEAIRSVDQQHMVLGSRFYGGHGVTDLAAWKGAAPHVDVISVNWYIDWSIRAELRNYAAELDKPFMVTEFYTKGIDSGLANTSGAGWIVATQAERGAFYQNLVLDLLESGYGVGAHWLGYMDNNPQGSADPSNKDSNKGIVTIQYEPYADLLGRMQQLNQNLFGVVAGLKALGLGP